MQVLRFKKGLLVGLVIAYTLSAMLAGAALSTQFKGRSTEFEAVAAMAYEYEPQPLAQTPVSAKIDLTLKPVNSDFSVEIIQSPPSNTKGKILIYHTHTYEAYLQNDKDLYQETEKWRTRDACYNVVRIGDELSAILKAKGYDVVHDTTAFEPPDLSDSYTRSLKMLERRQQAGETYNLYIDLHRDAYSQSMASKNTVFNGTSKLARIMVLIGKGSGQTYAQKPEWEKNYAIAKAITADLNEQINGLARDISIKSGRFNQHIAPACILVEVGNNQNTLEEALACVPYLADAIHHALDKE